MFVEHVAAIAGQERDFGPRILAADRAAVWRSIALRMATIRVENASERIGEHGPPWPASSRAAIELISSS